MKPLMRLRQAVCPQSTPSEGDLRDDEELVLSALAGDRTAGEIICVRYAPLVRSLVRRTFGPFEDPEDIVQDVFHSLYRDLRLIRTPRALRKFIISLTLNVVGYELRKRKVRRLVGLTRTGNLPDLPSDEGPALEKALLVRFYRLLDTLPTRDRTIVVLRYLEGMSLQEVAEATDLSLATVKRRLLKASESLTAGIRGDALLLEHLRAP